MKETSLMKHLESQKGFTLVELAIVMIIIGLLIGGILKGQELITNAQVSSTIAQMKGIDAAMTTFRDSYNAVPGDMTSAQARLPGCTPPTCQNAPVGGQGGNSRIDAVNAGVAMGDAGSENVQAWVHLNSADLLTGIDTSGGVVFGGLLPNSNIGGGFTIGYHGGSAALNGQIGGPNPRGGHYLAMTGLPTSDVGAANSGVLNASELARIDRKLDDGSPVTGSVLAVVEQGGACTVNNGTVIYDEANNPAGCAMYLRVQQ
ncbi:MAG: prepilin-type N-terminal cleavage/methylation domain-containing protein [Alphaproteobacteria bacterium]|nr:prepilin-type N-terminal cleavage/methylation domain-containing protein [Alphaproteobacteria bacterium]